MHNNSIAAEKKRIRDIIFIKEKNKYVLFFETSASIGVIDLNSINK